MADTNNQLFTALAEATYHIYFDVLYASASNLFARNQAGNSITDIYMEQIQTYLAILDHSSAAIITQFKDYCGRSMRHHMYTLQQFHVDMRCAFIPEIYQNNVNDNNTHILVQSAILQIVSGMGNHILNNNNSLLQRIIDAHDPQRAVYANNVRLTLANDAYRLCEKFKVDLGQQLRQENSKANGGAKLAESLSAFNALRDEYRTKYREWREERKKLLLENRIQKQQLEKLKHVLLASAPRINGAPMGMPAVNNALAVKVEEQQRQIERLNAEMEANKFAKELAQDFTGAPANKPTSILPPTLSTRISMPESYHTSNPHMSNTLISNTHMSNTHLTDSHLSNPYESNTVDNSPMMITNTDDAELDTNELDTNNLDNIDTDNSDTGNLDANETADNGLLMGYSSANSRSVDAAPSSNTFNGLSNQDDDDPLLADYDYTY